MSHLQIHGTEPNPADSSSRRFCEKRRLVRGFVFSFFIVCMVAIFSARPNFAQEFKLDRPVPKQLVGREFQRKIDSRLNLIRSDAELLQIIDDLQRTQNIAIVLDRRIDPHQKVTLQVEGVSLKNSLWIMANLTTDLSKSFNITRVIGDTVVIGPNQSLAKFRTLVYFRTEELRKLPKRTTRTLQEIIDKETVHWNDLDRPIDVLQKLAATNSVKITNPQLLRHDLWRHGTLFTVSFIEAASWILLQYDLTFEWNDDATEITLVPMPEVVGITKTYRPRKATPAEVATAIKEVWSDLKMETNNRELMVTTTIEQHEMIEQLVKTGNWPEAKRESQVAPNKKQPNPIPLANRNISLRVIRKPASAVLATLTNSGIDIQYDAAALRTAGIDLSANIDLDVKNADINELMSAICKPIGVKFRIEGEVIHLSPK